jgi:nocturnin
MSSCLLREWVHLNVVNEDFTVMQFNCLADGLAQTGNFTFSTPEELDWSFRWELIKEEITKVNPDVLCMQEMNHPEILAQFMPGHYMIFCPKLSSPALHCGYPPDGCVMLIRRTLFRLVDVQIVYFHSEDSMSSGGIVVSAQDKRNKQGIVFATTHLKSKAPFEHRRIEQIHQLLGRIKGSRAMLSAFLTDESQSPISPKVILTGDFNSSPDKEVYRTVYEDKDLCFDSSYNSSPSSRLLTGDVSLAKIGVAAYAEGEPAFTTFKIRDSRAYRQTIDYIWAGQSFEKAPGNLVLGAIWSIPSTEDIGEKGLPSRSYPSDHLSIAAKFGWHELL